MNLIRLAIAIVADVCACTLVVVVVIVLVVIVVDNVVKAIATSSVIDLPFSD